MCYFRVFERTKFYKTLRLKFNFLENGCQANQTSSSWFIDFLYSFTSGFFLLFSPFVKLQNNRSHQIRFQSKISFKFCVKKLSWTLFECFSKSCYRSFFLLYETIFEQHLLLAKYIQTELRCFHFPFVQTLGV